MDTYYLTDTGLVREHNEDCVIITTNNAGYTLMAVADGMGGDKAGEIASSIAIKHLSDRFNESFANITKADATVWIKSVVGEINNKIFKYTEENTESKGMGTTLVLTIIGPEYILFGNIGDSSGYVLKDKKLHKVTYDHTLVNLLVTAGELTKEEARNHPKKNILMNALGVNDPIEIDIFDCNMDVDVILLCSDGLNTMLLDEQIEKVLLNEEMTIKEKVKRLIIKSNNRGGTDNISVAYLAKNGSGDTK
jgi:protein phosphatase